MKYGFIHLSRAWYASSALKDSEYIDEVMIGELVEGTLQHEGVIRFYILNTLSDPAARLELFEDSFILLCCVPLLDVLKSLHASTPTPQRLCNLLKHAGFRDVTPLVPRKE